METHDEPKLPPELQKWLAAKMEGGHPAIISLPITVPEMPKDGQSPILKIVEHRWNEYMEYARHHRYETLTTIIANFEGLIEDVKDDIKHKTEIRDYLEDKVVSKRKKLLSQIKDDIPFNALNEDKSVALKLSLSALNSRLDGDIRNIRRDLRQYRRKIEYLEFLKSIAEAVVYRSTVYGDHRWWADINKNQEELRLKGEGAKKETTKMQVEGYVRVFDNHVESNNKKIKSLTELDALVEEHRVIGGSGENTRRNIRRSIKNALDIYPALKNKYDKTSPHGFIKILKYLLRIGYFDDEEDPRLLDPDSIRLV